MPCPPLPPFPPWFLCMLGTADMVGCSKMDGTPLFLHPCRRRKTFIFRGPDGGRGSRDNLCPAGWRFPPPHRTCLPKGTNYLGCPKGQNSSSVHASEQARRATPLTAGGGSQPTAAAAGGKRCAPRIFVSGAVTVLRLIQKSGRWACRRAASLLFAGRWQGRPGGRTGLAACIYAL